MLWNVRLIEFDESKGTDLTPRMKATVSGAVIAISLTTFASVGTATAATPSQSPTVASTLQNPPHNPGPPPPKFRSEKECRDRGDRDHHGKPGKWSCQRGPDRNTPWEYRIG